MSTETQSSTINTQDSSNKKKSNKKKVLFITIGILILAVVLFALFYLSSLHKSNVSKSHMTLGQAGQQNRVPQTQPVGSAPVSSNETLVYGSWTGQNSVIKAVNLATNTNKTIATLPINIKKVSILDPEHLIFIGQTDKFDHGKQLVVYDIRTQQQVTKIQAASGFGIDNYVLSPNKKYLATWEVAFAPGSSVMQGAQSRVYAVDLSKPQDKQLLYSEKAAPAHPVHYPLAVLNNGEVFTDRFLPNSGAGWAHGMSVSSFNGKTQQDIPQLQNGDFGTQPQLSPDGKYLAYAGYDGTRGNGTSMNRGYRQSILTPDTVNLLDTNTMQIKKIALFPNQNIYSHVLWDNETDNLIVSVISRNENETGSYIYNVSTKTVKTINLPSNGLANPSLLSLLPDNKLLIGIPDERESTMGNLGDSYASSLQKIELLGGSPTVTMRLNIPDVYSQYITVLPGNYFPNVLGAQTARHNVLAASTQQSSNSTSNNTSFSPMQLMTFFIKTTLAATRFMAQSNTSGTPDVVAAASGAPSAAVSGTPSGNGSTLCRNLPNAQCQAEGLQLGTVPYAHCVRQQLRNPSSPSSGTPSQATTPGVSVPPVSAAPSVAASQPNTGGTPGSGGSSGTNTCADSPLYVYSSNPGKKVTVTVQTPMSNTNAQSSENGFNVTTLSDGQMSVDGAVYNGISYDYQPNSSPKIPTYGSIITPEDATNVIENYAKKLGLNAKETSDLVSFTQQHVTSPYAFVTYFNQQSSQQILPLDINPQPDNYLNVVFYFKLLNKKPDYTPVAPVFESPLSRNGLTVVEVSEIVQ